MSKESNSNFKDNHSTMKKLLGSINVAELNEKMVVDKSNSNSPSPSPKSGSKDKEQGQSL